MWLNKTTLNYVLIGELNMELNVQDLQLAASVIDLATQRGAFKGSEAKAVGTIYEKITAFIQSVAEAQAKQKEEADKAAADQAQSTAPAEGGAPAEPTAE